MFGSIELPAERTTVAPDGSDVRVLLGLAGGGMAHFALAPGACSVPVRHRTVEEIWFVVSGAGTMWRSTGGTEVETRLGPGVCITIPQGTSFQFRADGDAALAIVGVTMPPWPGDGEAIRARGPWAPTVAPGAGLTTD
jgi:mannose-6-phosphate isomerase-like protein (cupin superfamily)